MTDRGVRGVDHSAIPWRVGTLERTVSSHGDRLDSLEDWRAEWRGVFLLLKVAFGTSLVSAIASILAIVAVAVTH